MRQITLRVSDESLAFVRRTSRQNNTAESFIWRQLIETGIHRSDDVIVRLDLIAGFVMQALCMGQRIAVYLDDDLLEIAREDVALLLNRMESVRRSRVEDRQRESWPPPDDAWMQASRMRFSNQSDSSVAIQDKQMMLDSTRSIAGIDAG